MYKLFKIITVLSLFFINNAFSFVSIKEHSNSIENFKIFIYEQNFSIDKLDQASNEYYLNYLDLLQNRKTELSVLQLFREKSIDNPQFVYTHYVLSLNQLNKISEDYLRNQEMLDGLFISLFGSEQKQIAINQEIIDNFEMTCLCADSGSCENENAEVGCSAENKTTTASDMIIPAAGIGSAIYGTSYDKKPVIDGSTLAYDDNVATSWLTNDEFKFINYARDTTTGISGVGYPTVDVEHPYVKANIHKAYGRGLSGYLRTVGVMDIDLCYDPLNTTGGTTHLDLRNKNVTTYGSYDESYWADTSNYSLHGCHVATTAVGVYHGNVDQSSNTNSSGIYDYTTGDYMTTTSPINSMMGVAYKSRLWFADIDPPTNSYQVCDGDSATDCFGPQHWELSYEDALLNGVDVMSNSWYHGDDTTDVLVFETYAANNNVTNYQSLEAHTAIDTDSDTIYDVGNTAAGSAQVTWTANQFQEYVEAMNAFQNQGVIVYALSNDGSYGMSTVYGNARNYADLNASMPYLFPELAEAWISVANVSEYSGGKILLSAPCAVNASWCISHDGYNILAGAEDWQSGAQPGSFWVPMTGTSMATPQVSGSIALLSEAFPDNTPETIAKRLLLTANNEWFDTNTCYLDTDTDGNKFDNPCGGSQGNLTYNGITHAYSELYGHGTIDMDRALSPIGTQKIPFRDREYLLAGSFLALSSYFGNGSNFNFNALFRDQLDGGFSFNIGEIVESVEANSLSKKLNKLDYDKWSTVVRNEDFTLAFSNAAHKDSNQNGLDDDFGLYLSQENPYGKVYLGNNYSIDQALNLRDAGNAISVLSSHKNEGSLLSLTEAAASGQTLGTEFPVNNNATINFISYQGEHKDYGVDERGVMLSFNHRLNDSDDVTIFFGQNYEDEGFLRTTAKGAFGSLTSKTFHTGASFNNYLGNNYHIAGLFSYGFIDTNANEGMLANIQNVTATQYNLGIVKSKLYNKNDLLSLNFSQPLRTESGSATLHLPSIIVNGQHTVESHNISLEPNARELNFDLSYESQLVGNNAAIRLGTQHIINPNHNKNLDNDTILYGIYSLNF